MINEIGGIKLFETISFFYNYADVIFTKSCVYVDKGIFCRCKIMIKKSDWNNLPIAFSIYNF